jgi:hypothetical protein
MADKDFVAAEEAMEKMKEDKNCEKNKGTKACKSEKEKKENNKAAE